MKKKMTNLFADTLLIVCIIAALLFLKSVLPASAQKYSSVKSPGSNTSKSANQVAQVDVSRKMPLDSAVYFGTFTKSILSNDKSGYFNAPREFATKTNTFPSTADKNVQSADKQSDNVKATDKKPNTESGSKKDKPFVNINTASKKELMSLKGIGEVSAERIIEYREKHGGFKKIDDIKRVKGIGDKKYSNIKDSIAVQ